MGLNFKELVVKEEIYVDSLRNRVLAVDSMNLLYQFLTTITGPDGSVFTNKDGKVTSHLIGLFNRTTTLMESGVKLAFVFDGKAPEIKRKTWEKRAKAKEEASLKFKIAEEAEDLAAMKKFSARTSILTKEMVADAKQLISALGLPIIQAPSEGEAQAAHLVKSNKAYAVVSQDYDNLIFGCPLLIRNLSIEGKRKKVGKFGYQIVHPELIRLEDVLKHLKLNHEQLIVLAILIGTDYNPGGIKGIGPKTALKLLQEHKNDFPAIFDKAEWSKHFPDLPWKEIVDTIKNIPVTDDYELVWKKFDEEPLVNLLVKDYDFQEQRVRTKLSRLREEQKKFEQKGLSSFF
jgi:flap endonuclease-1